MAAYVIGNVDIADPAAYEEYRKLALPTIAKYGGRYLVRGGPAESVEGVWDPKRLVVLEFESVERAKQWYNSEEYRPAKRIRHRAARTDLLIVQGT
jgi:uncharacterized protein (DUF1330 family)